MEIYQGFPAGPLARPVFLTIGNFDGVHRGHQELISELSAAARATGGVAGLLTFEPHPIAVLRPDIRVPRLTTNDERADLLAALGLDFVFELPFTQATAGMTAAEFMRMLTAHLPLQELWVGPDFALGKGREGDVIRLAELGREQDYTVRVVPAYDLEGEPVRSTRIRSLLANEGAVEQAAALLGRPYRLWGEVILGARRGRSLGFPTANLRVPVERLIPAYGVYACWAWLEDAGYPAVVNVGVRPSFDNGHMSVEAFLLDFSGDLYGKTLGLSFVRRLRGEKKFANIQELIDQIGTDAGHAREILAAPPTDATPGGWRELSHAADWQVGVSGRTPRELFANAAAAMYTLQDVVPENPVTLARAIGVEAEEYPDLIVAWLNRLLLGQELRGEMYTRFEIFEISERGLRANAYGYRGAPVHTAVKAVTYYDLDVRRVDGAWQAIVTFDV